MMDRLQKQVLIAAAAIFGIIIVAAIGIFADQMIVMKALNASQILDPNTADLPALKAPRLVISKADRVLQVFDGDRLVKSYTIALGQAPVGDKEIEGDSKTPEGEFYVFVKNPNSKFYLSLGLSYPNAEDADRGVRSGLITKADKEAIDRAIVTGSEPLQNTKLGGEIYIHGGGNLTDWTEGCIAMKNRDIKELFDALKPGVPVSILP